MNISDIGYTFGTGSALLSLLALFPLASFTLSAELSDIDKHVQSMEHRLHNDRDKLDFETKLNATSLVRYGDPCIDSVLTFTTGTSHASRRRTIGLDILFRIDSLNSRATILKLFSVNYVVLTNALPSFERLNSPNVVFDESASKDYNSFMFAYSIAREAVCRDSGVAQQILALMSENDTLCVAIRDAYRLLHGSGGTLPGKLSLRVNADYAVSIMPFLPQITKRIAGDVTLLEEFRKWYFGVLDLDVLDITDFAGIVNALELADGAYLYGDNRVAIVITRHETAGRKNVADLLKARKTRFDGRSPVHRDVPRN